MAGVSLLAVVFRVERVSGELVPIFGLRFSAKRDRLLPPPQPDLTAQTANVDLRTTTEDDFPQFLGPHRSAAVEHVRLRATGRRDLRNSSGGTRLARAGRRSPRSMGTP